MNIVKSLAEVYSDYFLIGAAVNYKTVETQSELLKTHFNSITCENEMKFSSIHPSNDVYTFEQADKIVKFAKSNGMKMRGHTLVWHNQTPDWLFNDNNGNLVSRETLYSNLKLHMETVMNRYKDYIYAWDVVNEAIADDGTYRNTKWYEICGEEYIEKAFRFAHNIDQKVSLFYNDYNTTNPIKRDAIYSLIKKLIDKNVPIHGIGMQGHWNIEGPSILEIREAIEKYASLGIKIHITELDLSVFTWDDKRTNLVKPEAYMLEKQANRYEEIFKLFREYRNVIESVTFWGAADDYTWLDNFPVKRRKNWPFIFDELHNPKESYFKITNLK